MKINLDKNQDAVNLKKNKGGDVSNKLKPCPFCGTKPHPITADLLTRPCFYYECENKTCHAAEKGWHDTEQEAIDAWNTRPIEDALQGRIAELEKKSMHCPRCGDPITNELGDNPICGACALASELNAMTLQARIAELEAENAIFRAADYEALRAEKLIYCAKCRDGIVTDDDGICGVCAGAQDGVIENLKKKVGEMARSAIVWHKYPNTKPFNSEEYLVISCGKYVIATWDFYAGRFIANDEFLDDVANWAYLPEPPREEQ